MIQIKRAYEPASAADGVRVLVDRLWPRGVSKEKAHIDLWAREVAPSNELRKWFNHSPDRWEGFRKRYREELKDQDRKKALSMIRALAKKGRVTLIFAAREEKLNNAAFIASFLRKK